MSTIVAAKKPAPIVPKPAAPKPPLAPTALKPAHNQHLEKGCYVLATQQGKGESARIVQQRSAGLTLASGEGPIVGKGVFLYVGDATLVEKDAQTGQLRISGATIVVHDGNSIRRHRKS